MQLFQLKFYIIFSVTAVEVIVKSFQIKSESIHMCTAKAHRNLSDSI